MAAEKQVAMKTGQKVFKNVFRQNLSRLMLGKVTCALKLLHHFSIESFLRVS